MVLHVRAYSTGQNFWEDVLVRPLVSEVGLLQQSFRDQQAYKKFCEANNLHPGILEMIWAAALAADGDYEGARLFAVRAAELSSGELQQGLRRHVELYVQRRPLQTKEHARYLCRYAMRRQVPHLDLPAVVASTK